MITPFPTMSKLEFLFSLIFVSPVFLLNSDCTAIQVTDLLIQTDETAKQSFFLNTFLHHLVPVLFVGPTGTGKTAVTNNFLLKLPKEK